MSLPHATQRRGKHFTPCGETLVLAGEDLTPLRGKIFTSREGTLLRSGSRLYLRASNFSFSSELRQKVSFRPVPGSRPSFEGGVGGDFSF